jgi:Tol biopolymer transport system component
MTVATPPRPSDSVGAPEEPIDPSALHEQALIEEARQRARRRRRRFGIAVFLLVGAGALAATVVGRRGDDGGSVGRDAVGSAVASPGLPRNGPIAIVTAGPGDGSGGGIYEVSKSGLGRRVFECGGSSLCWELEGAAWSPDGTRLAYGVESVGGEPSYDGLYVLDLATGKTRQVRQWDPAGERGGWYEIAWSPDGRTIAYVSATQGCCSGLARIYLVRADGSHRTTLPTGTASASWPSWSPDGTRIAFAAIRLNSDTGKVDGSIFVMRTDGTHRNLIARHGTAPAWSPDGTTIAYLGGCGQPSFKTTEPAGIRFVAPTGRDLTRSRGDTTCATLGIAGAPAWSPDGTKIAVANSTGVYLMNADGSGLTQLTAKAPTSISGNRVSWSRPAWRPLPRLND